MFEKFKKNHLKQRDAQTKQPKLQGNAIGVYKQNKSLDKEELSSVKRIPSKKPHIRAKPLRVSES